nr:integrase, catalytic region, zinc finger, CCHC-type, peptidase aspartic, catalytic [Tanacetum cinerariifolium]
MGTFRETLAEGEEGALHLGPERPRVYYDLSPDDKESYNADIRATKILLQGLPKDIYTLINHYSNAKDIWDNVKMLLKGFELTKEDRESHMYDDFEHLRQNKGETIHDYYVRVVVQNVHGQQNKGHRNNARGTCAVGNGGAQNKVRNVNPGQARQIKYYNCNVLDEEQLLFIAGGQDNVVDEDMDDPPDSEILSEVHNHDNYQDSVCELHEVHEMHDNIQPNCVVDSDAAYTSDSNMILYDQDVLKIKAKALKEQTKASKSIKALTVYPPNIPATLVLRALTKEIKEMKEIFEELEAKVDQNVVNRKRDEIEKKNLLIANDNLIADCLSNEVVYIATNFELTVSRFNELHDAHTVVQARCLELEAELSKLNDKIKKDDHNELVKRFSKLEESVATLREIIEEAKAERPLDRSLDSACLYTKLS